MTIRAALFDLDGTITRVDTARLYVRYQRDLGEVPLSTALRVAGWVLQHRLGIVDAPKVAASALGTLAGFSEEAMVWRCDDWARRYVGPHIMDGAREAIAHHARAGHLLVMVTGSTIYSARPLARSLGIPHVLATELEVADGRFTGGLRGELCYAEGKITKTEGLLAPLGISLDECVFYSDSTTDLPLLSRVREAVCVNPDPRLRRTARQRGWAIRDW